MSCTVGLVCSRGIGPERGGRKDNEDNYLVCAGSNLAWREGQEEKRERSQGEGMLVAVMDGMGGHEHGEMASTVAARVMAKLYRPGLPRDPARVLRRYIIDAHRSLYWSAREHGPVTMGTTVTAAWLLGDQLAWTQVGDSRMYLFREDNLRQITRDQNRAEFARRDGLGEVSDPEGLIQSFIYGSRGLGDDSALRIEPNLDSGLFPVRDGDRLLLCSDGLSGVVDDASIADVLRNTADPQAAAVACLERAIARGSTDNITVMVLAINKVPSVTQNSELWDLDDNETGMF